MKNSEHLILFMLGVVTLGITFLLLFALGGMNPAVPPVVEQAQILVQQADAVPLPPTPAPATMEVLDREVAETFRKTAAYLGRSTFEENEHIALLERLEFYRGLSSIKPERKRTAHDLIKDMGLLLTLKESVALHVKLSAQINAAVADAHLHLAGGKRNKAVARKLMERIKSLYAIAGLKEYQNRKLRNALAELRRAYKAADTSTASATASSSHANIPEVLLPYINKEKKDAATEVTPEASKPEQKPKPEVRPVSSNPVVVTAPERTSQPDPRVTKKYYRIMTMVSYYLQVGEYDTLQHEKITDGLNDLSVYAASLKNQDQERLRQAVVRMEQIGQARGFGGAWGSGK